MLNSPPVHCPQPAPRMSKLPTLPAVARPPGPIRGGGWGDAWAGQPAASTAIPTPNPALPAVASLQRSSITATAATHAIFRPVEGKRNSYLKANPPRSMNRSSKPEILPKYCRNSNEILLFITNAQ